MAATKRKKASVTPSKAVTRTDDEDEAVESAEAEVETEQDEDEAEGDTRADDDDDGLVGTDADDDTEADTDEDAEKAEAYPLGGVSESTPKSLARLDAMATYMREVQRHPRLSPEETQALAVQFLDTQDPSIAARLVTSNLRLVVKIAYEYRRAYKNIMDLVQEGNIGLMQAVKRYDPYRGVKLSSYAAWWIRAYILRYILNNWRLVKLGTTQAQRKLFFNLNKEKARLSAMGIEPSSAEIAKRLQVEEKEVIDMDRRLSSGEASLDAPVGDSEGRSVSRIELLPSPTTGPDASMEAREMGDLVHSHLMTFRSTLKGKDVLIFDKRMVAEEPLTLQELGDEFGISRERVRQLEARVTTKLREYLKQELGDAVGTS